MTLSRRDHRDYDEDKSHDFIVVARAGPGWVRGVVDVAEWTEAAVSKRCVQGWSNLAVSSSA
jgi:hypothetical protein